MFKKIVICAECYCLIYKKDAYFDGKAGRHKIYYCRTHKTETSKWMPLL